MALDRGTGTLMESFAVALAAIMLQGTAVFRTFTPVLDNLLTVREIRKEVISTVGLKLSSILS